MPFISVPQTIQANLRLTYDGQEVENVLHFRTPAAVTPADLAAVAEGVEDWWVTELAPQVPNSVVYREVYAVDLTTATGGVFTASGANGTTGARTVDALPNNCTIVCTLRTAFRGRSFRGRIYHIGIARDTVTDNTMGASDLAALSASYAELMNSASFGGCVLAVASRYAANAPRVIGISTEVIDTLFADATIDSQRRRLPGRGR